VGEWCVSGPVWLGVAWGVTWTGACRCQMGLNTGREGMGEGLSREKYVPGYAGCGSVDLGHELSALCECWY